jgi:hypothetical protein
LGDSLIVEVDRWQGRGSEDGGGKDIEGSFVDVYGSCLDGYV